METESKQPPRETYNEAYHHGPNKTPPVRQEVKPTTMFPHEPSDPY